MKVHPIHKNLSTSFVDLAALVQYLRRLQFVGCIHVELGTYEAEIVFTKANTMRARERDLATETTAVGSQAFTRILERARQPHGRIDVYHSELAVPNIRDRKIHIDSVIAVDARQAASKNCDRIARHLLPLSKKADTCETDDRETLLALTGELLLTIDRSLAKGGISFVEAFQNACALVSEDAPFIDPNRGQFDYSAGKVCLATTVSREVFLDAVTKALGRIFDRLRDDPRNGKLLLFVTHRIQALILERKADYSRLGVAARLQRLLRQ